MTRYALFPREKVVLKSLSGSGHDLKPQDCLELRAPGTVLRSGDLEQLATAIMAARRAARPVVLYLGAPPIKFGLSRFVIDWIRRGLVTHIATDGAGLILDYELAAAERSSEPAGHPIQRGQFGPSHETGRLNEIIRQAAHRGEGLGEALGRTIYEENLPHRDLSIAAAGWRAGVPVTAHVTIGADIIHAHTSCDGAALGQTSYTDFLIFARSIHDLEGGVYLNVGSAVTGPEVYQQALSMARNVAGQHGREIRHFTTGVLDLVPLPANFRDGAPGKDHPLHYFRPWKTILAGTLADGGKSHYVCGDHTETIPTLWQHLVTRLQKGYELAGSAA